MPKRSSRKKQRPPAHPNEAAKKVLGELVRRSDDDDRTEPDLTDEERSQLAALLGRRGGLKGGPARAKSLSARRRKQIARTAARARWAKK